MYVSANKLSHNHAYLFKWVTASVLEKILTFFFCHCTPMRTIDPHAVIADKIQKSFSSNVSGVRFLTDIVIGAKGVSGNILSRTPENLPVKRCTQFKVATSVRPGRIKGQTRRQGSRILRSFFPSYPGNKFSSRPATSWNSGTML